MGFSKSEWMADELFHGRKKNHILCFFLRRNTTLEIKKTYFVIWMNEWSTNLSLKIKKYDTFDQIMFCLFMLKIFTTNPNLRFVRFEIRVESRIRILWAKIFNPNLESESKKNILSRISNLESESLKMIYPNPNLESESRFLLISRI